MSTGSSCTSPTVAPSITTPGGARGVGCVRRWHASGGGLGVAATAAAAAAEIAAFPCEWRRVGRVRNAVASGEQRRGDRWLVRSSWSRWDDQTPPTVESHLSVAHVP